MSGPTRRLRAAVVGTGFVGPFHVDAIRRGGYADVATIVGSDPGRTAASAAALGVEHWSTDLAAVLADPDIDVVHVCTPNRTHVEIATAAIEAGKHVVVEKPAGLDRRVRGRGRGARAASRTARRGRLHLPRLPDGPTSPGARRRR